MAGRVGASSVTPLAVGGALALVLVAAWIALTAATGKTYHLAPALAAWAPALAIGAYPPERIPPARWAAAVGLGAVAAGWLTLAVAGIEPDTTIVADQPGGVRGEILIGALAGAAIGAGRLRRLARGR